MNYATIQTRVAEYLDRDDLEVKIRGWINDTRKDIAIKGDFDYLYTESTTTTTAGCANYALPADFLALLGVWLDYKKLAKLRPREADELTQTDSSATAAVLYLTTEQGLVDTDMVGTPDYYIERGMELQLYPCPGGAYTLRLKYYAQPADWDESVATYDAATDGVNFDYITTFHFEAVIWGAALRGAIYLDDAEKKASYGQAYDNAVKEMLAREVKKQQRDTKVRVKTWKDFDVETFQRIHKVTVP